MNWAAFLWTLDAFAVSHTLFSSFMYSRYGFDSDKKYSRLYSFASAILTAIAMGLTI